MPTIDQLSPAVVASDDDLLPVSQSGIVRRISRAQLLGGTQSSLALTPGLLGRHSPGLGAPESVSIGAGLTLANGVLSGNSAFSPSALPVTNVISLDDLVPVTQPTGDHAASLRTLLSSGNVDISNQVARIPLGAPRRISDWVGDNVSVEGFGAVGDGVTDDTPAFNAAISTGKPIVLGPKTYRVDGQWTVVASATLIGVAGVTKLIRVSQAGGAWINIVGSRFVAMDVIFDAGLIGGDSWGVLVGPNCVTTRFENCSFMNAVGPTLGTGLTIQARDGAAGHVSVHQIVGCTFQSNTCHGLWIQATAGADVRGCLAEGNGGYGICLDYNDITFSQKVRQSSVTGCRCINNLRGISIGNYNATNLEPPRWGLANPDATDIVVSTNICSGNSSYGIAVSGARIQVVQNRILIESGSGNSSGILCNASLSSLEGNGIVGLGQYGIDAGGSTDLRISGNLIENCAVGINAGGGNRIRVVSNTLTANERAITIFQVETDGHGSNFGLSCSDIWIEDNIIQIEQGMGGLYLIDGPARVDIRRNRFLLDSANDSVNILAAHTDTAYIHENTLNGLTIGLAEMQMKGAVATLLYPEILDVVVVPQSVPKVDSIVGLHQAAMEGSVSFIQVVSNGSGYSTARINIIGSGSGAVGNAYLSDGALIGIALVSGGSGYDPTTTSVIILGDGQGAIARVFVGLMPSVGRQLKLSCQSTTLFPQSQDRNQTNWTSSDLLVPANTDVVFEGNGRGWQATQFTSIDHLLPGSDGSVTIQGKGVGINLHSGSGGLIQLSSDAEPIGFLSCFGRGSPEGLIVAPPGSDYRNLDGGVGATLWCKRIGSSSTGWFAVG